MSSKETTPTTEMLELLQRDGKKTSQDNYLDITSVSVLFVKSKYLGFFQADAVF